MNSSRFRTPPITDIAQRQRGASLLEGIAYLGVAAMVILGAVSLLTSAFRNAQTNRASEEVIVIRTAVKKLYMGQANSYGTADITKELMAAKAFPSTLTPNSDGTAMLNAWGGDVTVVGNSSSFTVIYDKMPDDICLNMISGSYGWSQIKTASLTITTFPVTPSAASVACASGSDSNKVELSAT